MAKILFILRDPIQRAISNYWFSVNNGWEMSPMEEAFLHEEERWLDYDPEKVSVSPYAYLNRGRYIDYLLMYETYFPPENIKVILFERFLGSKIHVLELFAFLGVSAYIPSMLHTRVNQGHKLDTSLSTELHRYLVNYFSEPNARLAKHLHISLAEWQE